MKNLKKLSRTELKNLKGGKAPIEQHYTAAGCQHSSDFCPEKNGKHILNADINRFGDVSCC